MKTLSGNYKPVNVRPKRTNNAEIGSLAWVKSLGESIDAIGEEAFPRTLITTLKTLANFDYSVIFAYHQSEIPQCLFHTFSPKKQIIFVDEYLKGSYLLDPFFKACERKVNAGLYRIGDVAPDRFYQSEYYHSYYIQTGLSEEIGYTIYLPQGVAMVVSLMRSGDSVRFSAREFRLLQSAAPIVISLARRHWQHVREKFDSVAAKDALYDERSLIESRVSTLFSKHITPRETQVVAQVLEGHSSDSIAKNLRISVGTVRIHRRNVYAKLQISSQQELFSIFFKSITTGR